MFKISKLGILINTVLTFLTQLIYFFVSKYLLIVFGTKFSGLMRLFAELLIYLEIVEAGLITASTYSLYRPLAEKNYGRISILMNTISYLYKRIFYIFLFLGLIMTPILPYFIKDKIPFFQIYTYWILCLLSKTLNYRVFKYFILFTADQKFLLVQFTQIITKIIIAILQLFILFKVKSMYLYIIVPIFTFIFQYKFYVFYYNKEYNYIKTVKEKDLSILKDLKNLIWHKFGTLVVFNTDIILISKFLSLDIVVIYTAYRTVNAVIENLINTALGTIKPKIGKYIVENEKKNIFQLWKKMSVYFLGISFIITFVAYLFIDNFIILWIGEKFIFSNFTKKLIYLNFFINLFRLTTDFFKDGIGFFDDIELPISESLINLIFSITLVQIIGIDGVLIGTLVSNITIICITRPILVFKRCFNLNIIDYVKLHLKYLFLILILLFISNYFINRIELNIIKTWFDWLKNTLLTTIILTIITFLTLSIDKDFRNVYISEFKKF